MSANDKIFCFEAFDGNDALIQAAGRLYDRTQHPDERIPWGWIARSVRGRADWRPGGWGKHLLVATPADHPGDPEHLAGFAYGVHLPGFGGYVCYLGVADEYRRRGVGTRLFDQTFKVLAADAGTVDEQLPFVVWESHRPDATGTAADWSLWEARTRLFDRAGGLWVDGLELLTPNFTADDAPPVPLQLFVKPVDRAAGAFGPDELRDVAAGLLTRVYRVQPGDPLYDGTLRPDATPRLRPAREAARPKRERAAVGV